MVCAAPRTGGDVRGLLIAALAMALLPACQDRSQAQEAPAPRATVAPGGESGWHLVRSEGRLTLVYPFPDGTTQFLGLCDERPVFSYLIGEGPDGEPSVVVDGVRLKPEGVSSALFLDKPEDVERIARAKASITVELPGWRRELKPSPDIARFVAQCRAGGKQ
jgi:hypothetical protein